MTHQKISSEHWKKDYCKRFGLCGEDNKSCQCAAELRSIQSLLTSHTQAIRERVVKDILSKKRTVRFVKVKGTSLPIDVVTADDILALLNENEV